MKKAALCYSGQIRNFKECFDTHLKHLIKANPDIEFYIFGHFWNDPNLYGQKYWGAYSDRGSFSEENINSVMSKGFSSILFEKPIDFKSQLTPDSRFPHPVQNIFSMFYSIELSYNLFFNFLNLTKKDFDWVFRIRTDLFFEKDLILDSFDNSNIYLNNQYVHTNYAVNDLFAFSSAENMRQYCSTFSFLEKMAGDGCAVNPECFLGFNLHSSEKNIEKVDLQNKIFKLYRDK